MFQVRFHGRGGQGVVTAAELLAAAAFREGRYAQAFPSFGSERMGAPVMSFCRIDDRPILTHEPVTEPDALIIQDPTLLRQAEEFAGLGPDGYMLINSARGFGELGLEGVRRLRRGGCWWSPVAGHGPPGPPLPGAALLGGFAAPTWPCSLNSVLAAIKESSPARWLRGTPRGPGRVRVRPGRAGGSGECLSRTDAGARLQCGLPLRLRRDGAARRF